jgi:hypothetical protein
MKSLYIYEKIKEVLSDRDNAIFVEYLFTYFYSNALPRRLYT